MVLFKDMLIDTPYPILEIEDRGDDKDPLTSECTYCRREEWGQKHSTHARFSTYPPPPGRRFCTCCLGIRTLPTERQVPVVASCSAYSSAKHSRRSSVTTTL